MLYHTQKCTWFKWGYVTSINLDELHAKLEHVLTYMSEWFTANGLTLNIDKT